MNVRLNEFLTNIDEEEVASVYANLFFNIEGTHSMREAKNACKALIHDIQDALATRREENTDAQSFDKRFIFPIVIHEEDNMDIDEPIVDIAMMRYESIKKIPEYLKNHPSYLETADVLDNDDARNIVYEPNVLSYPVLLTPLDELKDYIVYIPSGHSDYESMAAAGIIYGLSLMHPSIEEGERIKQEIAQNIKETARQSGYTCDNADEILQAVAPSMSPEDYDDEFLDKMLTSRYNARIAMYDRIYCDMMPYVS